MPTSLVGLVLFVVLLAPGMCYRWRRSVRQPVQKLSELRELAAVALVSFVSDAIALAIFGVWRTWQPGLSLDAGRLVREPSHYIPATYVAVVAWVFATLTVACAVGLALAALAEAAAVEGSSIRKAACWLRGSRDDDVTTEPAWWCMFASHPDEYVYAGCELDDGNYVGGYVYRFSAESDETPDREIVLTDPAIRGADGLMTPMSAGAVVISARHLQFVTVTYVPVDDSAKIA